MVQSYIMNRKYKKLFIFFGKTLFYFAVILILLYLYSYSKTGGAHFIYNEF
ncbi:teichoic acid D-Ala incorporation-associated protein DltX [Lactococcus garvieae]